MIFIDSNIIIDLVERDPIWRPWSRRRLANAAAKDSLVINSIVVAECAPRFASLQHLRTYLEPLEIDIEDLSTDAAFLAGQVFRQYRRSETSREKVLADFLIGAHAQVLSAALLTRDKRTYARYFPEVPLITPENDNG